MVEIIVALITFAGVIISAVLNLIINNKNVKKSDLEEMINGVQLDNCKNYLVQAIAKAESGGELTPVEKERYYENYDKYSKLGGNSYIHSATEKLKREGLI